MGCSKYLNNWIESAADAQSQQFRQAVHIILTAISENYTLSERMVMKGGLLLVLQYESSRFTKDIDFSTNLMLSQMDVDSFVAILDQALKQTSIKMDYDLSCLVQNHKVKPPDPNSTFPTLQITIGYAKQSSLRHRKRLQNKNMPTVVRLDYSFNEFFGPPDILTLNEGVTLRAYSMTDLMAEKFRAILQQEVRRRVRRQDVYDIFFLLGRPDMEFDLSAIHDVLLKKSESRNLKINQSSMRSQSIMDRCKKDYWQLENEIEEPLPDFDQAYTAVCKFYESLPWSAR